MKIVGGALLPLLLAAGCMSLVGRCLWLQGGSAARPEELRAALFPLGERDASLAIGNDDGHLEVMFLTTDPGLQEKIVKQGIFIWFDPRGGEARGLGIRYPVAWSAPPAGLDEKPGEQASPSGIGKPGDDIEIYPDGLADHERVSRRDAGGLDIALERTGDSLMLRLTIPFRGSSHGPFTLDAAPGDLLGIGLETRGTRTTGETAGEILPLEVWRSIRLAARP